MTSANADDEQGGHDVLEGEEVVLPALGEVEKANNAGVVEAPHDLNLFENVGALREGRKGGRKAERKGEAGEGTGNEKSSGKGSQINARMRGPD